MTGFAAVVACTAAAASTASTTAIAASASTISSSVSTASSTTTSTAISTATITATTGSLDTGTIRTSDINSLSASVRVRFDGKLNGFSLSEASETVRFDLRLMNEKILGTIIGGYEPKPLLIVEPFHLSTHFPTHLVFLRHKPSAHKPTLF
ncbi:hypothetical protein V8G54_022465, partial [Vigna mungo]